MADIDRCAEAIKKAKRGRIHTFLSTSPSHRDHILHASQEDILEMITKSVTHARNLCGDVEWSAQDATRTEQDFLRRCVEAAIKAGAGTINLPDTVGYTYPSEYADMFRDILENVPGADEGHPLHPLPQRPGPGGRQLAWPACRAARGRSRCAINGIGERAGNAALEEIVMALKVRGDALPFHTGIETQHITRASRYVSAITGFPVQFNKAIVGKNAFAHESGIHQDGMLKDRGTYEIMSPETVGQGASNLVMGKHAGRARLPREAEGAGLRTGPERAERGVPALQGPGRQEEARLRRRHHRPGGRRAGLRRRPHPGEDPAGDRRHRGAAGGLPDHHRRRRGDLRQRHRRRARSTRCSTPSASARRTRRSLRLFQVHAVTEGTDAQAQVSVRLEEDGRIATGQAADTDTLTASAKAYINALNNLTARKEKTDPGAIASGF